MRLLIQLVVCGLATCVTWSCVAQEHLPGKSAPFFDARGHQPQYAGPAGEQGMADQLSEIRIGYFGPSDPQSPLHGHLWRAAQRAVEDANRDGGFAGKPFRLLPAWSDNPWGSGVTQVTQLAYRDRVWAIVGGVDGPTTHLAEQVVVKARLALVSPVSTDKTVNLTNVPWMFSLAPGDHLVAEVLAPEIARRARSRRLVLVSTNDHDASLLTRELRHALTLLDITPRYQFEYQSQSNTIQSNTTPNNTSETLVRECLDARPDEVIVVANAPDSLQLVRALRQAGFAGCIFGGPAFGRDLFVRNAAGLAGELVFPRMDEVTPTSARTAAVPPAAIPCESEPDLNPNPNPESTATEEHEDYASRQVYDAVRLVTFAVRKAGLNRAAIAVALRDLSPTSGVSGRIEWDRPGSNVRRPTLATLVQGRVALLDAVPAR
ncbi:MAG: ABC transporter substrate-binding protein [Pirellulaceae bacterium]